VERIRSDNGEKPIQVKKGAAAEDSTKKVEEAMREEEWSQE
jgi:hypothetical protein